MSIDVNCMQKLERAMVIHVSVRYSDTVGTPDYHFSELIADNS
jgi:mannose-1-phosphate guanylyltransferase